MNLFYWAMDGSYTFTVSKRYKMRQTFQSPKGERYPSPAKHDKQRITER